jgi:hypothetical protein
MAEAGRPPSTAGESNPFRRARLAGRLRAPPLAAGTREANRREAWHARRNRLAARRAAAVHAAMSRPAASGPLTFVIVASLSALAVAASSLAKASEDRPAQASPGAGPPSPAPGDVAWPDGFERWAWVKSGPSGALAGQPAGTHHIYANAAAVEGFRAGRFADGAVLVFDVLEGDQAGPPSYAEASQGRLRTDVMVRDQARYAATGGWGYAEWLEAAGGDGGAGRRVNPAVAANPAGICHACHVRLAPDRGFVVSRPPV